MKIFLIADTHFSHTNIIKYSKRPFQNIKEMNEGLIKNWNEVVSNEDIVYHLGDFTIDNSELKNVVNRLNGKIFLLRGNHDRKSIQFYENIGLEVLPTKTKLEEYKVILSHRPLENNQIPLGYTNIHGHIHNKELEEKFDKLTHINVSVEMTNYKPIGIEDVK